MVTIAYSLDLFISGLRFWGGGTLNFPCMKRDLDICQSRLHGRWILSISFSFCELLEDLVLHDEPDVGFLIPFSDLSFVLEVNVPTLLSKRQRVRAQKLSSRQLPA